MSSTPTLERIKKKLETILEENIGDAISYDSPLVRFRAIVEARKQLADIEDMLSQVELGLATSAEEEWKNLSKQMSYLRFKELTIEKGEIE